MVENGKITSDDGLIIGTGCHNDALSFVKKLQHLLATIVSGHLLRSYVSHDPFSSMI
jgi:hypothetical protein